MNIVPFFLSVIFIRIRGVVVESDIFRRLWYRQLIAVCDRPHCSWLILKFNRVFGFGCNPYYVY
jgi:hypothetical protein